MCMSTYIKLAVDYVFMYQHVVRPVGLVLPVKPDVLIVHIYAYLMFYLWWCSIVYYNRLLCVTSPSCVLLGHHKTIIIVNYSFSLI